MLNTVLNQVSEAYQNSSLKTKSKNARSRWVQRRARSRVRTETNSIEQPEGASDQPTSTKEQLKDKPHE